MTVILPADNACVLDRSSLSTVPRCSNGTADHRSELDPRRDHAIEHLARNDSACRRLVEIAGFGYLTASAMVAAIGKRRHVSARSRSRRLGWIGAASAFDGRPAHAARYFQTRK